MAAGKNCIEKGRKPGRSGQSLVEVAILFPLLLILLSGLIEFGFMLNHYLAVLDATRNAARFSSDSQYNVSDADNDCASTQDFYLQTACLVQQELAQEKPSITIDLDEGDDIIVSAATITGGATPRVSARHPVVTGWSYAERLTGTRNQESSYTNEQIEAFLQADAPNTGIIIVEIYSHYHQLLRLPWITIFVPDPFLLHGRTIMPLVSAEPTPTPEP